MAPPEPNQKSPGRFRWMWRGVGLLVVGGLVWFVVSTVQKGRTIEHLKTEYGMTIYSEPGVLISRLPASWQDQIQFYAADAFDLALNDVIFVNGTGKEIGDEELATIGQFKNLKALYLFDTSITDEGLAHIENMRKLERFGLSGTSLSDRGLLHLSEMAKLNELHLGGTEITDTGLRRLNHLSELQVIDLRETAISDTGLASLNGISKLKYLDLSHTRVSDAGLKHLKGLTKLQFLQYEGTQITEAGINDLHQSLPELSDQTVSSLLTQTD